MRREDPHSFTSLEQHKISHIDLQLRPNFSDHTLAVIATYDLDTPAEGSLYLDSRDLTIHRIHTEGNEVQWGIDIRDAILGERLHLRDLDHISRFTIELTTSSKASALQWLSPQQTAGGELPFLYSQCFAIHARSLFPCQDTPAVRFTFDAQIEVPEKFTAVMAAAIDEVEYRDGTNFYRFHMPQPIPSYLFAFAVGEIDFAEISPRCGIFAEPVMLNTAIEEFCDNEERMREAEKLFGPYIWDRYDVLIMPPSFPYGAMENPRLTFLSPVYVVGDRSGTYVVTHELAHAWTGNLVTNATWEDLWLNEGWTTYAETRITEILESRDFSQLLSYLGRNHMLEEIERLGPDSERTCLKFSQKGLDPDETITNIPYEKGYAFLIQLEQVVGREKFDAFIDKYISSFAFKTLTTEEFVHFLKSNLPQAVELVDVKEWLYEPGFPENAPGLHSRLYDEVRELISAYEKGDLPQKAQVSGWIFHQNLLFIQMLPKKIPEKDCQYFESLFELKGTPRYAFLHNFYSLCIRSGYRDVMPDVEHFLETIGISARVVRVYRALAETKWSQELARLLFERFRERYHPIAIANIERALTEAGV